MNRLITASAAIASVSLAKQPPAEDCCTFYWRPDFKGRGRQYCIDNTAKSSAYRSTRDPSKMKLGSVKCGSKVDAKICLQDYETTVADPAEEREYNCMGDQTQSISIGANQELRSVAYSKKSASFILEHHPWVTKGPDYLSLMREEKAGIIWDKITESAEMGGNFHNEVTEILVSTVFDEWGDEMDCRHKTLHSTGNVGKVFWVDEGDHDYTGIFQGGDSGFIRMTSTNKVVAPGEEAQEPFSNLPGVMLPAIAMKFLRDGVDSANTFGVFSLEGQDNYNFFDKNLTSIFEGASTEGSQADWTPIGLHFKSESDFLTSIGHLDFASYTQDGTQVENPVFPFSLRFEPADVSFPNEYVDPLEDQLQTIQPGQTLYRVYAMDKPESQEGTEQLIAKLVLGSTLVTSFWGDQHMYFRHQRSDDDLRYHPEWMPALHATLLPGEEEAEIRDLKLKVESFCPFAFLFQ